MGLDRDLQDFHASLRQINRLVTDGLATRDLADLAEIFEQIHALTCDDEDD